MSSSILPVEWSTRTPACGPPTLVGASQDRRPTGIAVVTICLNQRERLLETIESVLNQTHRELEYVVVDGASTDGSPAAARDVARSRADRRMTVISEPDRGISDAMNKGIMRTSAELIVHLNAGDRFVHDGVLARVAESHEANHWDWAVGETIGTDSRGNQVHVYRPAGDARILLRKNAIPHQATFLRRSVFERFGGFRTDLHQAMDYELWCRIGLLGGVPFHQLGFQVAVNSAPGRSSQLRSLLPVLWRIRRELHRSGAGNGMGQDLIFLSRAAAFGPYLRLKQRLPDRGRRGPRQ